MEPTSAFSCSFTRCNYRLTLCALFLLPVYRLVEDTAWHPIMPTEMAKWSPATKAAFKVFLGSPLKLFASIGHWWIWHFDLNKYTEKQKPRVSR